MGAFGCKSAVRRLGVSFFAEINITFDPTIGEAIRSAATESGHEPVDITSGAGHDACYVNNVAPTGMLFIPCEDGLSHNEAENITADHATAGAEVTLRAVLRLAQ